MSIYYDLHIHSCLSPCSDDDMTPMNIAGMAHLKGLDVIALTDHNCGFNLPAMKAAANKYNILFVPGIEATSYEEVHLLSYFKDLESAQTYCELVFDSLLDIPNSQKIFGNQIIYDLNDRPVSQVDKMLSQASSYNLEQLVSLTKKYHGAAVPAHINRDSFSLLANLGYVPEGLFNTVELYRCTPYETSQKQLCSSDSHSLVSIQEKIRKFDNIYTIAQLVDFLA